MVIRYISLICLLFTLISVGACSREKDFERFTRKQDSVILIDDIASYQSVDSFINSFGDRYLIEDITQKAGFRGSKARPPYQIRTLLIRDFSHLNQTGDLKIIFFNNNLMDVIFYPEDFTGYVREVSEYLKKEIPLNQTLKISSHVSILIKDENETRAFVQWADVRLRDLLMEWIRRFA